MTPLDWFPKQFSGGDIDGVGSQKLLRGANVPPCAVLVRETAQNSWDARLPGATPSVTFHGHELDPSSMEILRKVVFNEPGRGTSLSQALSQPSLKVLEVADRGTSGLGGPLRNDRVFDDGEPTDWVDFVLTIGARQDKAGGGGTFGFGKVISYTTSSASTIIIWSRTVSEGHIESRLIASAIGDSFDLDGTRYTGRQWWGKKIDGRIEPVVGDDADRIGTTLFREPFENGDTGTSLLILDPSIADDLPSLMKDCSTAVVWNLWPKLIPGPDGIVSMPISVRENGQPVEVLNPATHPILTGFVSSLGIIRRTQSGADPDVSAMSSQDEIRIHRPKALLGHLAITRVPIMKAHKASSDLVPIHEEAHHVALMRNDAELVVTYLPVPAGGNSGIHLCGVFRPVGEVDDYFARSEPPAHDMWEPATLEDAIERSHVKVALDRVKSTWSERTAVVTPHSGADGTPVSTGWLSNELADLVPGIGGTKAGPFDLTKRPKSKPKPRSGSESDSDEAAGDTNVGEGGAIGVSERARNRVSVADHNIVGGEASSRIAVVHLRIDGPPAGLSVTAELGAAFDGGVDRELGHRFVTGSAWRPGHLKAVAVPPIVRDDQLVISDDTSEWTFIAVFDGRISLTLDFRQKRVDS